MEIKIIGITDTSIADLAAARELLVGEIGEIIVRGPVVTREYDQLPEVTALAKIPDPSSQTPIWHRMGDVGYLDASGRLWFCGRKAERVDTRHGVLYPEQVEPVFNAHPAVARCALVAGGHDGHRPGIVVEPVNREAVATPSLRRKLVRELRELGAAHAHTDTIRLAYLHPHLPVDVRHNAKIHRLTLARWAAGQQGYEMDKREIPRALLQQ